MTTQFMIIRHGQTDWNAERRIQGWRDIELNANGHQQAERLAHHLSQPTCKHAPIHAVYSSDLSRAKQTAQAVATRLGLPLTVTPGVRERNYGILEGVPFDKMQDHHPAAAQVWKARDPDGVIPDGETLRQVHTRVTSALEQLAVKHQNQRILVVTHGGAMDIIWRAASGEPIQAPRKMVFLNASINRIDIQVNGDAFNWSLVDWGDVSHLEDTDNDVVA